MQIKVRVNETLKIWYSNQLSYEIIKYLYIEKQNYIIFLNYPKKIVFLYRMNPKQYKNLDFSKLSKQEIIDTQKYLIKKGYLDQSFVNARGEIKSSADGL